MLTDLQISKVLALAIGWKESQMIPSNATQRMYIFETEETTVSQAKIFDYRDWAVAGPIAASHDCFPRWNGWSWECVGLTDYVSGNTPQKTIALAVIQGVKK